MQHSTFLISRKSVAFLLVFTLIFPDVPLVQANLDEIKSDAEISEGFRGDAVDSDGFGFGDDDDDTFGGGVGVEAIGTSRRGGGFREKPEKDEPEDKEDPEFTEDPEDPETIETPEDDPVGEKTKPRTPGDPEDPEYPEDPEDPEIGDPPTTIEHPPLPPEEDDPPIGEEDPGPPEYPIPPELDDPPEEVPFEKLLCCKEEGGTVITPIVHDPLNPAAAQQAFQNIAMGAHNVMLSDGSFFTQESELQVESVGMDFEFVRSYHSAIKENSIGLLGDKWDFNLNKRIIPMNVGSNPQGFYIESSRGSMAYYNGGGRMDIFQHVDTIDEVKVKNFHHEFKAFLSRYRSPNGMFAELQRYAVKKDSTLPPLIQGHPDHFGRVFYVLRYKDGYREFFNCRGQILYAQDRNENTMTFLYKGPINADTFQPLLSHVIDTAGRVYRLSYMKDGKQGVLTNYKNSLIKKLLPTYRLETLVDPDGRSLLFKYKNGKILETVMEMDVPVKYSYNEQRNITSITRADDSRAVIENTWNGSAVENQRFGDGTFQIKPGMQAVVTDPNQNERQYELQKINDSYVIAKETEWTDNAVKAVTAYQYNDDYQVTQLINPLGDKWEFIYEIENGGVTQGDVRNVPGVTYRNNLARGNLMRKTYYPSSSEAKLSYTSLTTTYQYEPLFNSTTRTAGPGKAVTEMAYNNGWYASPGDNGNEITRSYPGRGTFKMKYDLRGLLIEEISPMGYKTEHTYSKPGYLVKSVFPHGTVQYKHDTRGNVVEVTDARGMKTVYEFDKKDLKQKMIVDAEGYKNTVTYSYDMKRNLIHEVHDLTDNTQGDWPLMASGNGAVTLEMSYEYNLLNDMTHAVHKAGSLQKEVRYQYDGNQNLIRVINPLAGTDIEMEYTPRDELRKRTVGGIGVETFQYDPNGNVVTQAVGEGAETAVTLYGYDGYNRKFSTTSPEGTIVHEYLDETGRTAKQEIYGRNYEGAFVPLSKSEYEMDDWGGVIRDIRYILDADGREKGKQTTEYKRDIEGKVIQKTDELGHKTTYEYDKYRLQKETDAAGNATLYTYDPEGQITSTEERTKAVEYTLADDGSYQQKETDKIYRTSMEYDALGRLVRQTDVGGRQTVYGYDSHSNQRFMLAPGNKLTVWEYDGFEQMVNMRQFIYPQFMDYWTTERTYDLNGRMTKERKLKGHSVIDDVDYQYDNLGRLTQFTEKGEIFKLKYDSRDNLLEETVGGGEVIYRKYNRDDFLTEVEDTKLTVDGMGRVVGAERYNGKIKNRMGYNSFGEADWEEQTLLNSTYKTQYKYNALGLRTETLIPKMGNAPSQKITYTYDKLGRLLTIETKGRKEAVYRYAGNARIASRQIGPLDSTLGSTTVYNYDNARQLTTIAAAQHVNNKIIWKAGYEYNDEYLPIRLIEHFGKDREYTAVTFQEYRGDNAVTKSRRIEKGFDPVANVKTTREVETDFHFNKGVRDSFSASYHTEIDEPGTLYGRNLNVTDEREKVDFQYDENGFLTKREVRKRDGTLISSKTFAHDARGNLLRDERFSYHYTDTDQLSQVHDEYHFGSGERQYANFYYDYKNRLVFIEYDPRLIADNLDGIENRRILYDQSDLPFAEILPDANGYTQKSRAFYLTHPEGYDIVRMDLQDIDSDKLVSYTPFFDQQGSLMALGRGVIYQAQPDYYGDLHLNSRQNYFVVAPMTETKEARLTMLGLNTRWEPFTELPVHLSEGTFFFDYDRNLLLRVASLRDQVFSELSERIHQTQKKGLAVMGIGFLPFMLLSAWLVAGAAFGVLVDYGITTVIFGDEYHWYDAMWAFEEGLVFGAMALEMKALSAMGENVAKRARNLMKLAEARKAAAQAKQVYYQALEEAGEVSSEGLSAKYLFSDAAARTAYWEAAKDTLLPRLRKRIVDYLYEAAEDGHRFAKQMLEDIAEDRIKLSFKPDMKPYGFFREGTNLVHVNPFTDVVKNGKYQIRMMREVASTALHEYVHFRGFNEFRTHFEQYRFLAIFAAKRPLVNMPNYTNIISQFSRHMEEGGPKAAVMFVRQQVFKRYRGVYRTRKLIQHLISSSGGRKAGIDFLLQNNPAFRARFEGFTRVIRHAKRIKPQAFGL